MARKRSTPNQFRKHLYGDWCIYCGEKATTQEHFPPSILCKTGWIFPACRECNCIAGTMCPVNIVERAAYVKQRLRDKYERELKTPDWSNEEYAEVKYNIRTMVKAWQKRKDIVQERLAWNALAYLACIDQHNDFAAWLVEINITIKRESEILRSLNE